MGLIVIRVGSSRRVGGRLIYVNILILDLVSSSTLLDVGSEQVSVTKLYKTPIIGYLRV